MAFQNPVGLTDCSKICVTIDATAKYYGQTEGNGNTTVSIYVANSAGIKTVSNELVPSGTVYASIEDVRHPIRCVR